VDKSGKQLEHFVELVEKILLPEGFNVQIRDKRFTDDGIQIAELDIFVSGVLGSTKIEWLIECRDRPSKGASPTEWVQHLIGKRQQFNFN
jgi:hypothetical protein